ncbi:MAG: hypothetical protein KGH59_02065, partial [Candidatus Micrarchaeota archaeon]|nr:hypothetical protein [Candidatus Micrarchaeota archaeon]
MEALRDIRVKMDQLTEVTISALKDRSRFKANDPIYIADAVRIKRRSGISFLEYSIERLEVYHASLGRFNYPDQHPLFIKNPTKSPVNRVVPQSDVVDFGIGVKESLIKFYRTIPAQLCEAGDDPTTYGQAASKDAEIIELMNERITGIGLFVAQSKAQSDPKLGKIILDSEALRSSIRDSAREDLVVERARRVAEKYELSPDLTEKIFRWLI